MPTLTLIRPRPRKVSLADCRQHCYFASYSYLCSLPPISEKFADVVVGTIVWMMSMSVFVVAAVVVVVACPSVLCKDPTPSSWLAIKVMS